MIYSFKPVEHNIYLFHEHIAHIFRQVFFYDPATFDDNLLVRSEFIPILKSAKDSVKKPLMEIVELYHKLSYGDKIQMQIAFSINNSTDSFNNKEIKPIKFNELDESISEKLKIFFEKLWTDYAQVIQMENDFGTVKDHYDKLTHEDNCVGIVCPFCGIETFEPAEGKYREDYDHLLAKADYPFVSINFNLLIPTCKKCNSNEKRKTDTLYNDDGSRRAVYYPYDSTVTIDDLEITIVPNVPYDKYKLESLLRSIDWHFEFKRAGVSDERLDSWNDIYGVKRRYTERIKQLEKHWFGELITAYKNDYNSGSTFSQFHNKFMNSAKYQILISGMGIIRYSYFNFLFSTKNFEMKLFETIA